MKPHAEFNFVNTVLEAGLSVIEASAGTGKTYAISHLVPRLLLDGTVDQLSQLLLVTFTTDAAKELSDRVRRVLEKLHAPPNSDEATTDAGIHQLRLKYPDHHRRTVLAKALLDIDSLEVSTIHAFCLSTLQSEGVLCGLPVIPELITDSAEFIDEALHDLWKTRIAADKLASAIATTEKWTLNQDSSYVLTALRTPDAVPAPHPAGFDVTLKQLNNSPEQFTQPITDALSACLGKAKICNKGAPSLDELTEMITCLRDAKEATDQGFFDSIKLLQGLEKFISKRDKAGKECYAEFEGLEAVQYARAICSRLEELHWSWQTLCVQELKQGIGRGLRANRQITYDGLIETISGALAGANGRTLANQLRRRYKVALIDESQDTDPRQFEIFNQVFVGFQGESPLTTHRLVLIGDPKQAIYAFRGADVNTYLSARNLADPRVFQLTKTYRSPQALVHATNAFFSRPGSLLKEGLDFENATSGMSGDLKLQIGDEPPDARLIAWIAPDEQSKEYSTFDKRNALIAATIASEIVRILDSKATLVTELPPTSKLVVPGHFAVLVSSHHEGTVLSEALKNRGVPAIQAGSEDLFSSEEASDLLLLLRALNEPRRSHFRYAALATRILGFSSSKIAELRNDPEKDDAMLENFLHWKMINERQGLSQAMAQIDTDVDFTNRLAKTRQGERRITNLRQLLDLLQVAALEHGNRARHILRWFTTEIAQAGDTKDAEERQLQLESDADAVQIVTMHSAKGLEFPLVFCPFLWSSKKPKGVARLSLPGEPTRLVHVALARESDPGFEPALVRAALEDRLRLAYVAITRAQARVWIYGGAVHNAKTEPSALDWLLRTQNDFDPWFAEASQTGKEKRHTEGINALVTAGKADKVIQYGAPPQPSDKPLNDSLRVVKPILSALPSPPVPAPWVLTSFSALTREKNAYAGSDSLPAPTDTSLRKRTGNSFLTAPGGALVGTAIHDWMEQWDFSMPDADALRSHLDKYRLPSGPPEDSIPFHERVTPMLVALRTALLPGLECTISQACPRTEASEWHFQLPINPDTPLGAQALAAIYGALGDEKYATILSSLPDEELHGFLHGFLDRVAFHNGIWGVIDWKTNNLGPTPDSYNQSSLMACAHHSHYLLQTHLYLVALRRFLGKDAKIAGAWLVFLRGIQANSNEGILHINPSGAFMDALDGLFATPQSK